MNNKNNANTLDKNKRKATEISGSCKVFSTSMKIDKQQKIKFQKEVRRLKELYSH